MKVIIAIIISVVVVIFTVRAAFRLGRAVGRKEGDPDNIIPMLETFKGIADNNLRLHVVDSKLNIAIGDRAVVCKSPMEIAQFSEALKELLVWFKPDKEHNPTQTT